MIKVFDYYKFRAKLIRPMLGTCCAASIYEEHVLRKAKKEIEKANKLQGKLTKSLAKYKDSSLPEDKEVMELQGILRAYLQRLGRVEELPNTVVELVEKAREIEKEFDELVKQGSERRATVFQRDKSGWPVISTHIILGNLKENLNVLMSTDDKSIIKTKVAAGCVGALDIKAVDEFMRPSMDIMRDADGEPLLCERPLHFEQMGQKKTSIALSEQLPEGAEFGTVLRVRKGSPLSEEALNTLFSLGKNNGFGSWRGSGNKGAYLYKLEKLDDYEEDFEEGWK